MFRTRLAAFVVLATTSIAAAQEAPTTRPVQNPLIPQSPQAPPARAKEAPPPFAFKGLPTTKVATVDGKELTQADLLRHILTTSYSTVGNALVMGRMVDAELEHSGVAIEDEEIDREVSSLLNRMSPGKTIEDVEKSGAMSREEIRRQAKLQVAIDKLYTKEMAAAGAPAATSEPNGAANIMKQLYMRRVMERFIVKRRGENPAPKPGLIAEITRKDESGNPAGPTIEVRPEEGLGFMMGLVKPASLADALNETIDSHLATAAAEKAGVDVSDDEVWTWAGEMAAKYPPPFDWAMLCRVKGSTIEGECERWRRIQCWKRATKTEPTKEEIDAFLKANMDYFTGRIVNVAHILVKTRDDVTGFEVDADKREAAKKKAEEIYRKAQEGVSFEALAKSYSEDHMTADKGGELPQPVKKWGGGLDVDFQNAAYALKEVGEMALVKSSFGWHVVKCVKVTPGREGVDFTQPAFAENIQDEYETSRMKAWLGKLRDEAKIEKVGVEDLWKMKKLRFDT
jgi:hypothetical protein